MPPRKRTPGKSDWPDGLHRNGKGYFYFRMPKRYKEPGKHYPDVGLGYEYHVAARHVENALAHLRLSTDQSLLHRLTTPKLKKTKTTTPFQQFVDETYRKKVIPEKKTKRQGIIVKISKRTQVEYDRIAKNIGVAFEHDIFESIDLEAVASYLDDFPPHTYKKVRWIFSDIYKHAISRGIRVENEPLKTLEKPAEVITERLTLEGYKAIYQHAPNWLQVAMDLGLQTLLREGDISNMMKENIILDEGKRFLQIETGKRGACIEFEITPPIDDILERARTMTHMVSKKELHLACPYIVHKPHRYGKSRGQWAEDRKHPYQVLPEQISRAFKKARDASGFYDHLPVEKRPPFREVRPLGADLLRNAGVQEHEIQKILGHSKIETTRVYFQRHGVRWTRTKAGIDLK